MNNQTIYNRSLIQFKVLTYLLGSTIVFFLTCLHLAQLNKIGYENSSFTLFAIKIFTVSSGTLLNTWATYNFLLLVSGVFFGLSSNNTRRILVQVISVVLLLEVLIYGLHETHVYSLLKSHAESFLSNLIFYELIVLFLFSTYWSWQSYKAINNQIIARKLLSTYVLLLIVFLFEFGVHTTNVHNYFRDKFIAIVNMTTWSNWTSWSNTLSFVVAVLLAFIWRNVRYENNEIII
ncbi:unnamed protein product [Ambrosiozyma monospora]|uniref:Unnamed protein product n=1 Tax=Ambrosiozyma monospora TaxID=43982 RepID=A0ACB5SUN2_AMBMO|nr:unnamed protein product [Ambrosiozyma monospora]